VLRRQFLESRERRSSSEGFVLFRFRNRVTAVVLSVALNAGLDRSDEREQFFLRFSSQITKTTAQALDGGSAFGSLPSLLHGLDNLSGRRSSPCLGTLPRLRLDP
jgi:hypothetical protein